MRAQKAPERRLQTLVVHPRVQPRHEAQTARKGRARRREPDGGVYQGRGCKTHDRAAGVPENALLDGHGLWLQRRQLRAPAVRRPPRRRQAMARRQKPGAIQDRENLHGGLVAEHAR
ncbi:hypothetical protein KL912_005178 [Ogataea haglerorum]|nr:hypothetical protein KL912_005178 [Ogataea haglerorum]